MRPSVMAERPRCLGSRGPRICHPCRVPPRSLVKANDDIEAAIAFENLAGRPPAEGNGQSFGGVACMDAQGCSRSPVHRCCDRRLPTDLLHSDIRRALDLTENPGNPLGLF